MDASFPGEATWKKKNKTPQADTTEEQRVKEEKLNDEEASYTTSRQLPEDFAVAVVADAVAVAEVVAAATAVGAEAVATASTQRFDFADVGVALGNRVERSLPEWSAWRGPGSRPAASMASSPCSCSQEPSVTAAAPRAGAGRKGNPVAAARFRAWPTCCSPPEFPHPLRAQSPQGSLSCAHRGSPRPFYAGAEVRASRSGQGTVGEVARPVPRPHLPVHPPCRPELCEVDGGRAALRAVGAETAQGHVIG